MTTLSLHNAWLPDYGPVTIHIQHGFITAMGADLAPLGTGTVIDARGMAVTPGLVNGHTHAAMTLFRGYGDDMPLMEWLRTRIWPVEAKMTDEDVYWGTRLACLEMIRSGTVMFHDMYWHFHAVARAVEDSGIRAGVGSIMIDVAGEQQGEQFKQLAMRQREEMDRYSDRIQYILTPHAVYTVSEKSLRWVAEFAEKHQFVTHIHLSETHVEVEECLEKHGLRPAFYLDKVGLLNERAVLPHAVHLNDDELDLIAERGATLVTNPVSNLKLAVGGIFPYSRAKARGIPMALGTDGAASNNSLDLFHDMKVLALLQKYHDNDPTTLPAREAWDLATGAHAPIFGQSGGIAVGQKADLLLLQRDTVETTPEHCLISNLVYAATGHIVDTVIVAGRVLMQNRHIPGEEGVRQEAVRRARALCG